MVGVVSEVDDDAQAEARNLGRNVTDLIRTPEFVFFL